MLITSKASFPLSGTLPAASSEASLSEPNSRTPCPKLVTRKERIKAYRPYTYKALGSKDRKSNKKLNKSQNQDPPEASFLEYLFLPGRAEAKARATYRSAKSSNVYSKELTKTSTAPPSEPPSKHSSKSQLKTSSIGSPQELSSPPLEHGSKQSSGKEGSRKKDTMKEHKYPSNGDRFLLWMLKSGGITEEKIDKRLARKAARQATYERGLEMEKTSNESVSTPGLEKEKTSKQEPKSALGPEKETRARETRKPSSSNKLPGLFDTFGRRTKEQPWDAFDLLAPWMFSSKEKKRYDQVIRELKEERIRQGKPKK